MIEILPAVMTGNNEEFLQLSHIYLTLAPTLHIDIQDSTRYEGDTTLSLPVITPYLLTIPKKYDLHIMSNRSEDILAQTSSLLPRYIFCHEHIRNTCPAFDTHVPIPDILEQVLTELPPALIIMTVEPGGQGRPFQSPRLEIAHHLRNAGYDGKIYSDGGVHAESIPLLTPYRSVLSGVCIGSYLKHAPQDTYRTLLQSLGEKA